MARRRWDDDDDLVEKLACAGRKLLASRYDRGWLTLVENFRSPDAPLGYDETHRFLESVGALEGYAPTFALSFGEVLDILRRSRSAEFAAWAEPYIVKAWRDFNYGASADRRLEARKFLRDAAALADEPQKHPGQPSEIRSETVLAWFEQILARTQRTQKAHRQASQVPTAELMPVLEVRGRGEIADFITIENPAWARQAALEIVAHDFGLAVETVKQRIKVARRSKRPSLRHT
jgi:hypothetical protein